MFEAIEHLIDNSELFHMTCDNIIATIRKYVADPKNLRKVC